MAREKYLYWPVEEPQIVLIKAMEAPKLQQAIAQRKRAN
jgi:hypothetical protein